MSEICVDRLCFGVDVTTSPDGGFPHVRIPKHRDRLTPPAMRVASHYGVRAASSRACVRPLPATVGSCHIGDVHTPTIADKMEVEYASVHRF